MIFAFSVLWAAGAIAAYLYAHERGIPWSLALSALPAFLLELSFYFTLGTERLRARIEKFPPAGIASLLCAAALLPYSLAALALGTFSWTAFGAIAALVFAASF